jgi:hypothetical protein
MWWMTFPSMIQSLWFGTWIIVRTAIDHQLNVVNALDQCNSCDFYLNPFEKIDRFTLNGHDLKASHSPEVNHLIPAIYSKSPIWPQLGRHRGCET